MRGGVTAASSVKLRREGAELGTFPSKWLRRLTLLPPRAAGDREKPSLLWSLWRLCLWGGREGRKGEKGP